MGRPWEIAVAAKLLQSCLTLCDPINGSPPGSSVPGILQARIVEWVAISFFNAWKWKVKVKSLSRVRLHGLQPTRLLRQWDFPGKSTGVGCHCLLWRLQLAGIFLNTAGGVLAFGTVRWSSSFHCCTLWDKILNGCLTLFVCLNCDYPIIISDCYHSLSIC